MFKPIGQIINEDPKYKNLVQLADKIKMVEITPKQLAGMMGIRYVEITNKETKQDENK